MGTRAMALEAAAVAFDDSSSAVESEVPETVADRLWGEKWRKRLIGPIMEEERQLRVKKETLVQQVATETVTESLESDGGEPGPDRLQQEIDSMVEDELEVKRQMEMDEERDRLAWEKERQDMELMEYERDRALQESEDEARYESLQAQYAQEWDDWVIWRSMHSVSPQRERPAKKQKMVLHLQVQGELAPAKRLDFDITPGMPTAIGLTWTVLEEEAEKGMHGEQTKASSSQSSTEKLSPVTPEKQLSAEGSASALVPVQGHIRKKS